MLTAARTALVALIALLVASLGVGPAHAQLGGSFSAQAVADTHKITVRNAGAPVTDTPFDGGGFTAQAVTDNLGSTIGFAVGPNPGELLLSVPGLAGGFGSPVPAPPYPFVVQADTATPDARAEHGPYLLAATVDGRNASALAAVDIEGEVALGRSLAEAFTTVDADGTVTATARSTTTGFAAGPLVIGAVVSEATVTKPPAGQPQASSSLDLTGVSIAGTAVGYSDGAFSILGTPVGAADLEPILEPLLQAGIAIEFLEEKPTATGVISGGVRLTLTETNVTPVIAPSADASTVVIEMGRSFAAADNTPAAVVVPANPSAVVDSGSATGSVGAPPATASGSTTQPATGGPPAPMPTTPGASPNRPETSATTTLGTGTDLAAPVDAGQVPTVVPDTVAANTFYLVLVLGALMAFGGLGALRVVGPREDRRWSFGS